MIVVLFRSCVSFNKCIIPTQVKRSLSQIVTMDAAYPSSIKNVVSKMTKVCQNALSLRISRMEIELPPGADWGVEVHKKSSSKSLSNTDRVKKSNREAARLFGEMFSALSSNLVVLFPSEEEAFDARTIWGILFRGQVLSIDAPSAKGYGKLRSRKFTLQGSFNQVGFLIFILIFSLSTTFFIRTRAGFDGN